MPHPYSYSSRPVSTASPTPQGQYRRDSQMQRGDPRHPYTATQDGRHDDDSSSEDWNVYDDFNNTRPPSMMGIPRDSSYHDIPVHGSYMGYDDNSPVEGQPRSTSQSKRNTLIPSGAFGFDARNGDPDALNIGEHPYAAGMDRSKEDRRDSSGIELITVPALGAEFSNEEVKAMKKPYKRKKAARDRGVKAKSWMIKDSRICGGLRPQVVVIVAFFFLGGMAAMLFFVIPRIPTIAVQTINPLEAVPDGASMRTHLKPTNFSMNMNINLRADNTAAWIPTKLTEMEMKVTDIRTSKVVGEGTLKEQSFAAKKRTVFKFPVSFAYGSINATGDETWLHWINACGPKYDNTPRSSLNLQFIMTMKVSGLLGKKGTSAQLANLECPFTLQPDQT